MVHVPEDQLAQVQYLITQSLKGNHVLFDPALVRDAFYSTASRRLTEQSAIAAEEHLKKLMLLPTLAHKKAYLERLDGVTLQLIIRTYFNIVETNMVNDTEIRH